MVQMIRTITLCMAMLLSVGVCAANGTENYSSTAAEDPLKTKRLGMWELEKKFI